MEADQQPTLCIWSQRVRINLGEDADYGIPPVEVMARAMARMREAIEQHMMLGCSPSWLWPEPFGYSASLWR